MCGASDIDSPPMPSGIDLTRRTVSAISPAASRPKVMKSAMFELVF